MTQKTNVSGSNLSSRLGDFSPQARAYAVARPTYPSALVERLITRAGVHPGAAILDAGAGTGIFTALLSGRGFRLTALEPGDEMRAQALPLVDVIWVKGTFEKTGMSDQSQRWIVSAQAFHWADPQRALPELHRILKPGGHLTVLWNNRLNEGHEILTWTADAIQRHVPDFQPKYRDTNWADILISTGDFREVTQDEELHVILMTRERYLDLWRSSNRLNTIAGPARFAAFIVDLEQYLERRGADQIEVPYLCQAWTTKRAEGRPLPTIHNHRRGGAVGTP